MTDLHDIERQATKEVAEEAFRLAVETRKTKLRETMGRPWWVSLFPFRIKIERL